MTASNALVSEFQSILDFVEDGASYADISEPDLSAASALLQKVLCDTILPRRITVRAENGNRLSVIARNRRVVAIVEVHPSTLWTGEAEPQDTVCELDFEAFGAPFANVVTSLISGSPFSIDQHFVTDALPDAGLRGYPASNLSDDISRLQAEESSAVEQLDVASGGLLCSEFAFATGMLAVGGGAKFRIDFGAGEAFEKSGTLVGFCFEEAGKLALGE